MKILWKSRILAIPIALSALAVINLLTMIVYAKEIAWIPYVHAIKRQINYASMVTVALNALK